jgi:hypothetical protein
MIRRLSSVCRLGDISSVVDYFFFISPPDAKSWRFRCRVMSVVSLLTYVPFIVLVAVFVPKSQ